ncbi:MAG TPA: ATP-binding protein [Planktothrix sp.]|jgi:signal transduction histidine kinase
MGIVRRAYQWLFSSLANQLLITYLLVITIALVTVSLWALLVIKAESINDLHNSLEVEAVNLALEIDNDLRLDSPESRARIKAAVDRHALKLGVSITVVNQDGRVLADSGANRFDEDISNQHEINDALAGIVADYTRTNWLFVAYPVRAAGHTTGVIRMGVQLFDIEHRLNSDLYIFLKILLATAVVTVLISLWLARRVNRPVREMSAMARNIALSGDLSEFVPVRRRDEIGELGLSFNQMIGRLREQERLRQEFIANASHELKTPTMAIGSVVEALQAGAGEDPKLRVQFLDSLERLVDRQESLLRDLLDISRLDGGSETNWAENINLLQVISDAVEQIGPQAQKKEIHVLQTVDPSMEGKELAVPGNAIQLQRAVVNILTNAVNYTNVGGSINVICSLPTADTVVIKIADSGIGIEANDLPHIFERFYRADKSRQRAASTGGTGLGLAITQEIIARHHGRIDVESTIAKGSTFTIILPAKYSPMHSPRKTGEF